jgi:hypothetical protein
MSRPAGVVELHGWRASLRFRATPRFVKTGDLASGPEASLIEAAIRWIFTNSSRAGGAELRGVACQVGLHKSL